MNLHKDYSLKKLNTFGIDVKASLYAEFHSGKELKEIFLDPKHKNQKKLILGGGSNILFTKNFDGLVLRNRIGGIEIIKEDHEYVYVKSGAGVIWHDLVMFAINKNLGGIENLSLIPGTVGAAPIQNIGAYGVELKDVFVSLESIHIETQKKREFNLDECEFGYRDSIFKRELKGKHIILSITLRLSKNPKFNISYGAISEVLKEMNVKELSVKAISDAVCFIRRSKLPDPAEIGNAGSFFKNPEIPQEKFNELKSVYPDIPSFKTSPGYVKVPAGWLNEKCGWKGKIVGNTGVHKNQALVLVNYGNAEGEEIKKLSEEIQSSVLERFGIRLETEVNII
jgi:UDP-N-acetylmuramate dehydrogenase